MSESTSDKVGAFFSTRDASTPVMALGKWGSILAIVYSLTQALPAISAKVMELVALVTAAVHQGG